MGYSECSKEYKPYIPILKKLVIARDVKFDEEEAWNWSANDPKDKSICVDLEEEKQIQHDNEEAYTPPYYPHSSSSLSSHPRLCHLRPHRQIYVFVPEKQRA